MILRIVNKLTRLLGRLPDIDAHDTAVPYLNAVFEHVLRRGLGQLRPTYTWGLVHSAFLAAHLRVPRISAIELGVAGGNGLVALEGAAAALEAIFEISIDVHGFDGGSGLPAPTDWRDLPNLWPAGAFPMDEARLRARLRRADLVLGPVEETVATFLDREPAPIGFIAFDLDHYTSTMHALRLLEAPLERLMPRVHCYFDDILGFTCAHHNGERRAIAEFNQAHPDRQISQVYGLRFSLPRAHRDANWTEKMFMTHLVEHPRYAEWDGYLRQARLDLAA